MMNGLVWDPRWDRRLSSDYFVWFCRLDESHEISQWLRDIKTFSGSERLQTILFATKSSKLLSAAAVEGHEFNDVKLLCFTVGTEDLSGEFVGIEAIWFRENKCDHKGRPDRLFFASLSDDGEKLRPANIFLNVIFAKV